MDPVTTKLQEWTPQEAQEQEKAVQTVSAMKVAAENTADAVGIILTDKQAEKGGIVFHYAVGMVGGWSMHCFVISCPFIRYGPGY